MKRRKLALQVDRRIELIDTGMIIGQSRDMRSWWIVKSGNKTAHKYLKSEWRVLPGQIVDGELKL